MYGANSPYDTRPVADTPNERDNIFQQAGGSRAVLTMKQQGNGYLGTMTMGVGS